MKLEFIDFIIFALVDFVAGGVGIEDETVDETINGIFLWVSSIYKDFSISAENEEKVKGTIYKHDLVYYISMRNLIHNTSWRDVVNYDVVLGISFHNYETVSFIEDNSIGGSGRSVGGRDDYFYECYSGLNLVDIYGSVWINESTHELVRTGINEAVGCGHEMILGRTDFVEYIGSTFIKKKVLGIKKKGLIWKCVANSWVALIRERLWAS